MWHRPRAVTAFVINVIVVLILAAPLVAEAAEHFQAASGKRDDPAAMLGLLGPLAAQGNAEAQLALGFMYSEGYGVTQDHAEAVKWFQLSAGQGNARAQAALGAAYASGRGVRQDPSEAAKWRRRAADQGDAIAQAALGAAYSQGYGVPRDHAEAVKWYRRAADQGNVHGHAMLGYAYAHGFGVPQDVVLAYMWFDLAAAGGHKNAVTAKDDIAQQMARADIAQARQLARAWRPKKERH